MGWLLFFLVVAAGASYWLLGALAIAAFFAVGSLPFWAVVAIVLGVAWYLIADDEGGWAVVPFAAFALFVHFVARFNLIEWAKESWRSVLLYSAWYLGAAFVYAMFRWLLHLRKKAHELDGLEAAFRKEQSFDGPLEEAPDEVKLKFNEFIADQYYPDVSDHGFNPEYGVVPTFYQNKFVIFRWFWWWPLSLLGWLFNDLIREIWDVIKQGLEGVMNWVSGLVFGRRSRYVLSAAQSRALKDRKRAEQEASRERLREEREEMRRHER